MKAKRQLALVTLADLTSLLIHLATDSTVATHLSAEQLWAVDLLKQHRFVLANNPANSHKSEQYFKLN